jgi:sodium/potassium-transporting ATPase subunit alpha
MDSRALKEFVKVQEEFASGGERVLLLARVTVRLNSDVIGEQSFDDTDILHMCGASLTAVGLISLFDPPKEDAAETVRVCRRAGIRFMMVTGKHFFCRISK